MLHLLSRSVGSSIFNSCVLQPLCSNLLYSFSTLLGYLLHSIFHSLCLLCFLLLLLQILSGTLQSLHFNLQLYYLSFSLLQHSSPADRIFATHLSYLFQPSPLSLIVSLSHLCKTICPGISQFLFPLLVHCSQLLHCHLKY